MRPQGVWQGFEVGARWDEFHRPASVRERAQSEYPGKKDMPAPAVGEILLGRDRGPTRKRPRAFAALSVVTPAKHVRRGDANFSQLHPAVRVAVFVGTAVYREKRCVKGRCV